MKKKIRVGIVFGGRSAEHEVSLQSAKNIVEALDKTKYEPVLIGVDKTGRWLLPQSSRFLLNSGDPKLIALNKASSQNIALIPQSDGRIANLDTNKSGQALDVVFPILHGPFGEDGTVQGLLKLSGIPFVGSDVLGSAIGMDKDVMKRLLKSAGIPIGKYRVIRKHELPRVDYKNVIKELGTVLFIKPANLGSSVGVSKSVHESDFWQALDEAFRYDRKVIVEKCVQGREIECSVLGNDHPIASVPGEVKVNHAFYSYEAKYLDESGAILEIPANLPKSVIRKVQELAVKTFQVLECEGMARVDFFVTNYGRVLVNEINTIPGFTSISMYPKLWEASGISYRELISKLISLALERHTQTSQLKISR